jgi:hypothetical protein
MHQREDVNENHSHFWAGRGAMRAKAFRKELEAGRRGGWCAQASGATALSVAISSADARPVWTDQSAE